MVQRVAGNGQEVGIPNFGLFALPCRCFREPRCHPRAQSKLSSKKQRLIVKESEVDRKLDFFAKSFYDSHNSPYLNKSSVSEV